MTAHVELKNVKYAAFASEETNCFAATVYIDGKKAGTVSNDGHGGSDMFDPWSLQTRLNEIAAGMPVIYQGLDNDAEILVGDLFEKHQIAKDLKHLLAGHLLFVDSDGKIKQSKRIGAASLASWLGPQADAMLAAFKIKREQVLNYMAPADAMAAFVKGA